MFVDQATLTAEGGRGGDGCVSFRREKYVPRGGPDGAAGGAGGNVVLRADPALTTLVDFRFRPHVRAQAGTHGRSKKMTGAAGADCVVPVPVGTLVYDVLTGELVADLALPGQQAVIAPGGRGGRGNTAFASARNPAPRRRELGEPPVARTVRLELKLLADLGLLGLPNAGKSTLLSTISAATPEIAAYPFTTKQPVLGVMRDPETEAGLLVADLPGLIAGAHQGKGMGIRFLQHVERTRLLLHLVEALPVDTLVERYRVIRAELDCYGHDLASKPEVIAITKCDLLDTKTKRQVTAAVKKLGAADVCRISAQDGTGMDDLRDRLFALARQHPRPAAAPDALPPVIRLPEEEQAVRVSRNEDGDFVLDAPWLRRRLVMTDFASEEGLAAFQRLLEKRGVSDALRAAGCTAGMTVIIGDREFVFSD